MFYITLATSSPQQDQSSSHTLQTTLVTPSKSTRSSSMEITQSSSIFPTTYPPCCVIIDDTPYNQLLNQTLGIQLCPWSHSSDLSDSSPNTSTHNIVPTPSDNNPPSNQLNTQPNACSMLAHHIFSHAKDQPFTSKADVATWCQKNQSGHSMAIEYNQTDVNCRDLFLPIMCCRTGWRKGRLILESETCGVCNCKMRFLCPPHKYQKLIYKI